MRGEATLSRVEALDFQTVIDVGSGAGLHSTRFAELGKSVTAIDIGRSVYFRDGQHFDLIIGDFLDVELPPADLVWCCHVLEHVPNVGFALDRLVEMSNRYLALTLPFLKPQVVGGHLSLWTLGLLAYRLIFARVDCSEADLFQSGKELCAIVDVTKRVPDEVLASLSFDKGDVDILAAYFPDEWKVKEGFRGDLPHHPL